MVTRRDRWWLAVALVAAGGCSAEFGGRCEVEDDCSETQVCTQGYCLPDEAEAGPDDGVPDDMGPMDDGGRLDGGDMAPASDAGAPIDAGGAQLCDRVDGVMPAYDPAFDHRPCPDEHTVALWRFDDGFEPLGPEGSPGPTVADGRDRDAVQLNDEGHGGAARFVGDDQRVVRLGVEGNTLYNDEPMTIEMWARFVAFDDDYQVLVSTLDVSGGNRGGVSLYIDREGETYRFGAAIASQIAEGQIVALTADELPLAPGQWVHLAMRTRREGREGLELYVDGERASQRGWAVFGSDSAPLRFGESGDGDGPRFEGLLDEVRVSSVQRAREDFEAAAANPPQ